MANILLFVLVLLFPTQLGLHFWPNFAFVHGLSIDYLSPTLYLTDLLLLAYLSFHLRTIFNLLSQIIKNRFFLLFLALLTQNILQAQFPFLAAISWLRFLFLTLFVYLLAQQTSPQQIIRPALTLSLIFSSLLTFIQLLLQHSIGGLLYWLGERHLSLSTPAVARLDWPIFGSGRLLLLRPYATFSHPNSLAGFLFLGLLLLLTPPLRDKKGPHPVFIFFVILAILATFSRATILASIILLPFALWPSLLPKAPRLGKLIIALVFLLTLVVFVIPPSSSLPTSLNERLILAQNSLDLILAQPLGLGLNHFIPALVNHFPSLPYSFYQPVHNVFVLLTLELGFPLIIFFLFLFDRLRRQLKIPTTNHLPLFAILLTASLDHYWLTLPQNRLLLALSLALLLHRAKIRHI